MRAKTLSQTVMANLVGPNPRDVDRAMLTYLGLSGCPAGLLITFNVAKLADGVKRLIRRPACGR